MAFTVTVEGQIYLPNGSGPSAGTVTYELDGNAKDSAGNKIVGRGVFEIPDGGVLDGAGFTIIATANLTPSTRQYVVRYVLEDAAGRSHAFEERWSVTASTPQNIGDLAV